MTNASYFAASVMALPAIAGVFKPTSSTFLRQRFQLALMVDEVTGGASSPYLMTARYLRILDKASEILLLELYWLLLTVELEIESAFGVSSFQSFLALEKRV